MPVWKVHCQARLLSPHTLSRSGRGGRPCTRGSSADARLCPELCAKPCGGLAGGISWRNVRHCLGSICTLRDLCLEVATNKGTTHNGRHLMAE